MENFELFHRQMDLSEAFLRAVIGIVVVLLVLAIIDVLIILVSKIIQSIEGKIVKNGTEAAPVPAVIPAATPAPAPESVELIGVDEPTAAVIMAIVSNKSGIPLERLRFKSIKLTEENK